MTVPKLDERDLNGILKEVCDLAPFYVPELKVSLENKDSGTALIKIFAVMFDGLIKRLNEVPGNHFLAFLNTLGVNLLPPQRARAPVTFLLSDGVSEGILIPAGAQLAANPKGEDPIIFETEKSFLATPAKLMAVYSVVPQYDYIYDHSWEYLNNTGFEAFSNKYDNIQQHCLYLCHNELFNLKGQAAITLILQAKQGLEKAKLQEDVSWEWWNGEQWIPLTSKKIWPPLILRTDNLLSQSEEFIYIELKKDVEDEVVKTKINGIEGFWIRCRLLESSLASKNSGIFKLALSKISATVNSISDSPIEPEMLFYNDVPLLRNKESNSKDTKIYPFGLQPRTYDTFYIGSREVFSKRGAKICLHFETEASICNIHVQQVNGIGTIYAKQLTETYGIKTVDQLLVIKTDKLASMLKLKDGSPIGIKRAENILEAARKEFYDKTGQYFVENKEQGRDAPTLSWEYWNGKGWDSIKDLSDTTGNLLLSYAADDSDLNKVIFNCPEDMAPTVVNGQDNFWIRVRIINGDYGRERYIISQTELGNVIKPVETDIIPPYFKKLKITYDSGEKAIEHLIAHNNGAYIDVNSGLFTPFIALEDKNAGIYLGFDKAPQKGMISLFISLEEQLNLGNTYPRIEWQYLGRENEKSYWRRLEVEDGTYSLTRTGILEFIGPPDFVRDNYFGKEMYWIRGVDVSDSFKTSGNENGLPLKFKGLCINTAYASQCELVKEEMPDYRLEEAFIECRLTKSPIISEEVWINEISVLSESERAKIASMDLYETKEVSDINGNTTEFWIRWKCVEDFMDSMSDDRHYTIDRVWGIIRFGNGVKGAAPPEIAGNIRVTYRTGGGARGNVEKHSINTLRNSIAFVDGVSNPEKADGGSDTETIQKAIERGTGQIKHRNRAVSREDYESLVKQASPGIARVKCLENYKYGDENRINTGWVTVVVVPQSEEKCPKPSVQLIKQIYSYLEERAPVQVVAPRRLIVSQPDYIEISVKAVLVIKDFELASKVEVLANQKLQNFLDPLHGGYGKRGWEFGRLPHVSDFYSLLEGIKGIDHVTDLEINATNIETGKSILLTDESMESIQISPCSLVTSGVHDFVVRGIL